MNRQEHLPALRRIIQRFVLIPEPDQLVLSVPFADVDAEFDQCLIYYIPERIRLRSIGSALNRDCPLVVIIAGRTPGAVLLFHIQSHPAVPVYAVVAGCLRGLLLKPFSQAFRRTLAHHAMRRDPVNAVRPLPGMVRRKLLINHHRTVRVCHYSSPSFSSFFSLLSCSCSSTLWSFVGIGSPRYAAFSTRLSPSLEI